LSRGLRISQRNGKVFRNVTKGFGLESVPRHDITNGKRARNMELTSLCTAFLRDWGVKVETGLNWLIWNLLVAILSTGMNLRVI